MMAALPTYGKPLPVHKRYKKYGATAPLLEPIFADLKQTPDEREVRKALLLIGQSTDGAPPSEALLGQAATIEEAVLNSPSFVMDTLLLWCVHNGSYVPSGSSFHPNSTCTVSRSSHQRPQSMPFWLPSCGLARPHLTA